MRSHEVLKRAIDKVGVKSVAAHLRISPALVYKWCQEFDPNDPEGGGTRNPLDRLLDIVVQTRDVNVVNWLCHESGGFYVPNPVPQGDCPDTELLRHTQQLVSEFGKLLTAVTTSVADDAAIEPDEADRIRAAWEQLKSLAEEFCVACERGMFDKG